MSTSSVKYAYPYNLNIENFVSLKLSTSNYLLWETQMMSLIESQDLLGFIHGDIVAPDSEVNSSDGNQRVLNPYFTSSVRTDHLVKAWITRTLSEEALGVVVGLKTSANVWKALRDAFSQNSQAREFELLAQLQVFKLTAPQVNRTPDALFLHQSKYAGDLLQRAMMVDSKPIANPMTPKSFSLKNRDSLFHDPTLFRSIVGGLQYRTMTRLDLSYAINVLMKRILRFVKGTTQVGLQIRSASSLDLYAFCDADWAGCPSSRQSTTGFCTFLGSNCISWSAKKQSTVARSSAEAKYRMASTTAELTWLSFLLRDIGIVQHHPATLFCDNLAALYMSINPIFHARTKHIEVDYHFVREKVALGSLVTRFVSSNQQLADIFTKPCLGCFSTFAHQTWPLFIHAAKFEEE
ncbi:hypothetical protein RJ640_016386 [Escallonia rubra]|uniref:Uncharacterized protein n=1 Tax=Escallonia rubra TaxID=112253 RepID=A0AA88RN30_9ASTE|nr:hypothetical protein RJ640_016386 [Escallonia rubra]